MNIIKYLGVFPLLIVYFNGTGQSFKNHLSEKKIAVRFNILNVLDPYDANVSVGAEYRLNQYWSAGSDVGYIFTSDYLSESKKVNGIILRPFIRYYPKANKNGFFELELHYKYVAYQITDWIGRDVDNGVPAYEEYTTFNYNKNVYGLHIKTGTKANLSRNKKLKLEAYMGLGIRYKKQGVKSGSYIRERGFSISLYNPEYSSVVIPLGMRLLYDIN